MKKSIFVILTAMVLFSCSGEATVEDGTVAEEIDAVEATMEDEVATNDAEVVEITGTEGTVAEDAKAIADITCDMFSLGTLNENDPAVVELTKKRDALVENIQHKYPTGSDEEKELQKLIEEELDNCQAYKELMEAFGE